jgi:hypothetical protein
LILFSNDYFFCLTLLVRGGAHVPGKFVYRVADSGKLKQAVVKSNLTFISFVPFWRLFQPNSGLAWSILIGNTSQLLAS